MSNPGVRHGVAMTDFDDFAASKRTALLRYFWTLQVADAEDCVQETLAALHGLIASRRLPREEWAPVMYGIARRKWPRRQAGVRSETDLGVSLDGIGKEVEREDDELLEVLRRCLERVKPIDQEMLVLKYVTRRTTRQIVDLMAQRRPLTQSAVSQRLHRARLAIQECVTASLQRST